FKNLSKKYITAIAIILMLGNCYVFMYSLSRNGFLITTIYLMFQMYFLWRDNRSKLENFLISMIFPFSALAMIVFPLITSGDLFERLNLIFAGRFIFTRYFLTYEPLKLFGIVGIPVPLDSYVIDSSYIYLVFRLGIVAFVLYFVAMILLINKMLRRDMRSELAVVLALTVGGINETYLFSQSYKNLIFIFLGVFLYSSMATLKKYLPNWATNEKLGFKIGAKEIKISDKKEEGRRIIPINISAVTAFLLVFFGLLTSLVYICAFPKPNDIYLPQYEVTKGETDEVYLTEEEVKSLKKQGDIVRGYVDEETPLYRMQRKGTAEMEYVRYIFSYGLWGGSIVAIAFLLIWSARSRVRYLLRNKNIGPDYKENVLLVHNYYRIPGGEDIVVANEKKLLEDNGHKVILYSRNNDEAGDHNFLQKIGLAFVALFNIRTYREIASIIDKEKIDVIHVHNTVALISPAVYLVGINRGIPVIQTIHNFRLICPNGVCYIKEHICERCLEHGLKASLLYNCYRDSKLQTFVCVLSMKIQRMLLTYRAINYICLTEFNKSKLMTLKQIREENVYIKPNFTTIDVTPKPFEERKRQIVYAGRIEKIKGVDMLLQAWMKLGDKAPKLIICGSGELESWCKEYIENNEISNVEMRGQIPNSEVKKLVGESLAIIYPTQWYEGFPMAVAEAYTMGTPILASDIGNVGNLVDDGISGIKFKSNSVVAIAKAVETFTADPIRIPDEYLSKYTADSNYRILKEIYENIRRKN
ncbi:MAG: glycosyltransferase family 4 protein, partial [Lachnospiraceae bacterium]|nr:glycosyltransferase family 4 protein [Lachnospiraceae bacterium]